MKSVLVLGSTGSIGVSSLEVLSEQRATHNIIGLSCYANHEVLVAQALETRPAAVGVTHPGAEEKVRQALNGSGIDVVGGEEASVALIERLDPDMVLVAVSGAKGLFPSMAAVEQGKRLALANKESLVMAGHLVTASAQKNGAEILPVDSEHSAVFQALRGEDHGEVSRIILTASGGPFVDLPRDKLGRVTAEQALKHPTWEMGTKITIDSATMMNKALEIVEARWLFDLPADRIDVVVHRQSIVHSMVEFTDGSIIAQMGSPDMKVPIQYALTHPERLATDRRYFEPGRWPALTFEKPDFDRFPSLELGFRAAREGGLMGTVMNAANEAAVDLFLKGAIKFDEITPYVGRVMERLENRGDPDLGTILSADQWAREELHKCTSL